MLTDDELDALLGPGSPTRVMLADASTVYAAFPAFIYPVLSPKGGKGVDDHDRIGKVSVRDEVRLEDVIGRARDTIDLVLGVVFADEERREVAAAIEELHRFIHGELADGSKYHAWENDLWNWTWAAIMIPLMDAHEKLRGWPSDQFREDAYAGLRAVGALFGAASLPDTYDGFIEYRDSSWLESVDPSAAAATSYLLGQRADPSRLRSPSKFPHTFTRIVSGPARHIARVGLLLVNTDTVGAAMGMSPTRADEVTLAAHRHIWRLIPRRASSGWVECYMRIRLRFGSPEPVWRTHYSPAALAQYRQRMRAARAADTSEPPRPSTKTRT
ncbi:DUF2236 domain-containing protein [Gordonia sp. HY002]|uniref:oxygenase MpaB family protein n=1 Tax=Gordonia zhenghanii TaxID=2911516 RepID=UPI001EEFFC38|nr:oxygenase MpaB family protein [Gordonia zhenghanii]MCF8572244.1 DUF2236 domain-containing protein [Gordonia zhenghanii]MCF8605078.1 DUF2236 domain-containing protein [Gordonia zhenghanii]